MMPRIVSLHRGKVAPIEGAPQVHSAIRKEELVGPVRVGTYGIEGDEIGHRKVHGGPFKALCCYSREYYTLWRERFGAKMPVGSFGENLSLEHLTDEQVCIGDVYRAGSVRVQVTGPRQPCGNLARHWGIKDFHRTVEKERKTGFYLRVLEGGTMEAGTALVREERLLPEWDLISFWAAVLDRHAPRESYELLEQQAFLDPSWRQKTRKLAAALEA